MKEIISIENVVYKYKVVKEDGTPDNSAMRGLDGVTLSVYEGEFLVLVGHNGSGKSTLAKMMNGLLLPQKGTVTVFGQKTDSTEPGFDILEIRKKVGMVFQNPDNQMVASIVEDDVAFGPENLGVPREEIIRRVQWALDSVGMAEYRDRTPTKLSGGQKQRIAIAGALAMKPRVLILDESTAMLDPQGRKEVLQTVHRLNREEGITVVLITHFMEEALDADRIVVLSGGKTVMSGSPREVFSRGKALKEIGLAVPRAVELNSALIESGFPLKNNMTVQELGEDVCQYLSKS